MRAYEVKVDTVYKTKSEAEAIIHNGGYYHYAVTAGNVANLGWKISRVSNPNWVKVPAGTILKCIKLDKGYHKASYHQVYVDSAATDVILKIRNHSLIVSHEEILTDNPEAARALETKTIKNQLKSLHIKEQDCLSTLENTQTQIKSLERRLRSLEKFSSDAEAIAHILAENRDKDLSTLELQRLIEEAGIKLSL